jgi:hypothetical protein
MDKFTSAFGAAAGGSVDEDEDEDEEDMTPKRNRAVPYRVIRIINVYKLI